MARAKDVPRQIQKIVRQEIRKVTLRATRTDLSSMGRLVVREMKSMISKGQSPISGDGRFLAYKPSYKKAIKRGKGPFKTKRPSPVNLKLTGAFLKALTFKLRRGARFPTLRIGFFKKSEILKELGHRKGTNKQHKRPVVPNKKEKFARPIQKIINAGLDKIAKKLSK